MCGNNSPGTRVMMVEGARMMLCPNCARFGDGYVAASKSGPSGPSMDVIEQRLEKREKRRQTRDIYEGTGGTEIVEDYGGVIREARMRKGMDIEQFAASISEKKGIIAKIETNNIVPDDKLRAKIEKALGISLMESVSTGAKVGAGTGNKKMTLENFIKRED